MNNNQRRGLKNVMITTALCKSIEVTSIRIERDLQVEIFHS